MRGSLLDTNVPSEMIRQTPEPLVRQWIDNQEAGTMFLSVITVGELRCGVELLPDGARRRLHQTWLHDRLLPGFANCILPVTQAVAEQWAVIDASSRIAGRKLGVADALIAATALVS